MSVLLKKASLCLFASGACALIAQTAWLRELRLIFGASTPANAAVLAIFMGGLGLGGFVLGRRVQRVSRPFALYGTYEMIVGATCAVTPFLVDAARFTYRSLGGTDALGLSAATVLRLVLSVLVLGVPVFVMGGTFPAAARAVTNAADSGRRSLALLYGVNTLGAVAGTLVTTFFLFEACGVRATLWIGCLLNVGVGLVARNIGRALPQEAPVSRASVPSPQAGSLRSPVPALAAMTGFVFLLCELVWYRMLAPLLGGSTYSFGLVLACALTGVGVGGALFALVPRPASFGRFAITCALQAILLMAPFALGDRIAYLTSDLHVWGSVSFPRLVSTWAVVTALVVLPPALVAGYQFPLLIALRGEGRADVGKDVGDVYAANTVGSILGSLGGGFGLIPLLTATGTWRLCGALLVFASVVVAAVALLVHRERARALAAFACAALATALLASEGPTAVWRHSGIGAGRHTLRSDEANERTMFRHGLMRSLLAVEDGVESSIATHDANGYSLLVNGKSDGNSFHDAPTGIGTGLVAALLHPNPRRAFVVGLGTGQTPGWLAKVPTIEHVDVAEIEPGVVRFASVCKDTNFDVVNDPKVEMHIGDGRELLLASRETYDIISSEPSNPYRAGVASLYSVELYEGALAHLAPGGMFAQWLQAYELEPSTLVMVLATMRTVFSDVSVWQLGPSDLLVLGSASPVVLDVERIEARLAQEPYATAFGRIFGVHGAAGIASLLLANSSGTQFLVMDVEDEINTDDRPLLEASFARSVGSAGVDLRWVVDGVLGPEHREARVVDGTLVAADVEAQRLRVHTLRGALPPPYLPKLPPLARAYIERTAPPADAVPVDGVDELFLASALLSSRATQDARFAPTLLALEQHGFATDAAILRVGAALTERRFADVDALLGRAVELLHSDPWPNVRVADDVLGTLLENGPATASWIDLMRPPFAGGTMREDRVWFAANGERRLGEREKWRAECVQSFALSEPYPLWIEELLEARATCYERFDSPLKERARADVERARR